MNLEDVLPRSCLAVCTNISVRDYRAQQFSKCQMLRSFFKAAFQQDIIDFGADHIAIATEQTGGKNDLTACLLVDGRTNDLEILTPDDIMDGKLPKAATLIYDEDGYYMGGVIAERLKAAGIDVVLRHCRNGFIWAGKTSATKYATSDETWWIFCCLKIDPF